MPIHNWARKTGSSLVWETGWGEGMQSSWCDLGLIFVLAITTPTLKSCLGYILKTKRCRRRRGYKLRLCTVSW